MTPCCTNCYHWDEESIDTDGLGVCDSLSYDLGHERDMKLLPVVRTSGDNGCGSFQPKRVTPAPTHLPSETD